MRWLFSRKCLKKEGSLETGEGSASLNKKIKNRNTDSYRDVIILALGIEAKILFEAFADKKIAAKSPPVFSTGTPNIF